VKFKGSGGRRGQVAREGEDATNGRARNGRDELEQLVEREETKEPEIAHAAYSFPLVFQLKTKNMQ